MKRFTAIALVTTTILVAAGVVVFNQAKPKAYTDPNWKTTTTITTPDNYVAPAPVTTQEVLPTDDATTTDTSSTPTGTTPAVADPAPSHAMPTRTVTQPQQGTGGSFDYGN